MKNIHISVIIPVYNAEKYLEQCLNSILNQSFKNIEIICVDDGSTDNSKDILEQYCNKYSNVIIFYQENSGSGVARNKGLNNSVGEYISFIDADDFIIDETSLEQMFNLAKKKNSNMVGANLMTFEEEKFVKSRYYEFITEEKTIKPENYGIPWFFYRNIFKRDFIIKNNITFPDYLRGQDPVFLAEILSKIDKIDVIPVDFYAYRYSKSENKLNTREKKVHFFKHFLKVFTCLKDPKFDNLLLEYEKNLQYVLKMEIITEDDYQCILEACEYNLFFYNFFIYNLRLMEKEDKIKKTGTEKNEVIKKLKSNLKEQKNEVKKHKMEIKRLKSNNNDLNEELNSLKSSNNFIQKSKKMLTNFNFKK